MQHWCSILTLFLVFQVAPSAAQEPPLRVATLEYPPYITQVDEHAKGLVVDVVNEAFARIGRPIQIEFFPVARGQVRLLNGLADAFFSIKKTPEREQTMLFTQRALMSQDYVFFVRRDSPRRFNGHLDSLADARIGIVSATSYGSRFDAAAQAGSFKRLEQVTSHETNFRKLLAGRIDAVICSRLVGLYYLDLLNGLDEVDIGGPIVETTFSYLVFTKQRDFTALSRQFDLALDAMEHDGTLKRLINAYPLPQANRPPK